MFPACREVFFLGVPGNFYFTNALPVRAYNVLHPSSYLPAACHSCDFWLLLVFLQSWELFYSLFETTVQTVSAQHLVLTVRNPNNPSVPSLQPLISPKLLMRNSSLCLYLVEENIQRIQVSMIHITLNVVVSYFLIPNYFSRMFRPM